MILATEDQINQNGNQKKKMYTFSKTALCLNHMVSKRGYSSQRGHMKSYCVTSLGFNNRLVLIIHCFDV